MSTAHSCAICEEDLVAVAVPAEAVTVATMVKDPEAVALYIKTFVLVADNVVDSGVRVVFKMVPLMSVLRNLTLKVAAAEPVKFGSLYVNR